MIEKDKITEALQGSSPSEIIALRILAGQKFRASDFEQVASYQKVQPGDLITAEWMNKLLLRLARLELLVGSLHPTGGSSGDFFSVFGKPLIDAVRLIDEAGVDFTLGKVLDTTGVEVKWNAPGTGTRIVIGQFFVSDDSTSVTTVNLLVTSANATGGFLRELGSDAKDIIAKVVYQAAETQIANILAKRQRAAELAKDRAQSANTPPAPAGSPIPAQPVAAAEESAATAAASKPRASKKAAKGGQKAAGSDDAGGGK
jgi:hypothetical protein